MTKSMFPENGTPEEMARYIEEADVPEVVKERCRMLLRAALEKRPISLAAAYNLNVEALKRVSDMFAEVRPRLTVREVMTHTLALAAFCIAADEDVEDARRRAHEIIDEMIEAKLKLQALENATPAGHA